MKINNTVAFDGVQWRSTERRALSIRFGFRFNIVLCFFVFWTLLQATMAMQFLPFKIVQAVNYLKDVLPALGILACGILYLDKLKVDKVSLPFILFCFFVVCNVSLHMIITDVADLKQLSQPIMFLVWTFCMFVLVPSVFDSLPKIERLLWVTTIVLVPVVVIASYYSYSHGFEVFRAYGGSRRGALRYSFVYLNPGYVGGICYSIVCASLILKELSVVRWEKIITLSFIGLSFLGMILASSRTYILASLILFLFYFWHKGGIFKKCSWVLLVGATLLFIKLSWELSIEGNYFGHLNHYSSNRLQMWLQCWEDMMSDGIEWKLFFGNGIYIANWIQSIALAGGRVAKSFTRLAIDNVYLEMFIMQGAIGFTLFVWGLVRLLKKGYMFNRLKGLAESVKLRGILSTAYGALLGILVGALFASHFPSVGNTINSMVFPASVSVIFVIARKIKSRNSQIFR